MAELWDCVQLLLAAPPPQRATSPARARRGASARGAAVRGRFPRPAEAWRHLDDSVRRETAAPRVRGCSFGSERLQPRAPEAISPLDCNHHPPVHPVETATLFARGCSVQPHAPEAATPACQVSSCAERDMGFDTSDNCLLGRPRALDAMLAQVRSTRFWRRMGLQPYACAHPCTGACCRG